MGLGLLVDDVIIGVSLRFFYDDIGDRIRKFCGSKLYWILC